MISLHVNGKVYQVDVSSDTPLLWVLRDHLNLKGTKYSCGIGECGYLYGPCRRKGCEVLHD